MRLRNLIPALSLSWAAAAAAPSLLETGSHCVAYKAEKTMFLVSRSEVVGKNCDVSAQVLPEVGGLYNVEVNVPIRSFASGDAERDKDVMQILKASERPEITFRTKAMTAEEWRTLFAKSEFDLEGQLTIGERSFPVILKTKYSETESGAEVDGFTRMRFKDFDIKPPTVVGGVVAKAKPDVELHFHLQSHRILGADQIRLGTAKKEGKQ